MKMKRIFVIITIFTLSLLVNSNKQEVYAGEENVRAKIGIKIKSGKREVRAKSRERLKSGDLLQIYVHPEESSYIYIIHATGNEVNLLNMTSQHIRSSTLILPSVQSYYEIDGKNPREEITIICSPKEIAELSEMTAKTMTIGQWQGLEKRLTQKNKIFLAKKEKTSFAIAGNVRSLLSDKNSDPFAGQLQIYSGKGLLLKKYEFKVKDSHKNNLSL